MIWPLDDSDFELEAKAKPMTRKELLRAKLIRAQRLADELEDSIRDIGTIDGPSTTLDIAKRSAVLVCANLSALRRERDA